MEQMENQASPGVEPERGEQGSTGRVSWLVWLVMAILVYVLSTGPMIMLCQMRGNKSVLDALGLFYSPLRFAYQNSGIAKGFFDWYIHVWGVK